MGKSGVWLLISLIPLLGALLLFIFMLLDSDLGPNQCGENPKDEYQYTTYEDDNIENIGEGLG